MLSRLISRSCSHLRLLTLISSNTSPPPLVPLTSPPPPIFSNPKPYVSLETHRCFSSNNGGGDSEDPKISGSSSWNITSKDDENDIFGDDSGDLTGISDSTSVGFDATGSNKGLEDSWTTDDLTPKKGDIFDGIEKDFGSVEARGGGDEWETAEGYKPWSFDDEEKTTEIFDIGDVPQGIQHVGRDDSAEREMHAAENAQLEKEKAELTVQLKGPNRAFGDLIAASGITDVMLESLILLKDLDGVEGLPPLTEIEDIRLEKSERKSSRAEIERKKQEEIAKSRVRQVDDKGRAYGTGRRKCSIARVWIQPGEGKFIVNDKHFDTYFPILDHRADLLRPFMETKTLGLWDVACTVKGGGVSGQVGAVRLGISRALQNWEPGLRPNLRSAGFLTRDSRVVERKKPGKAKARKSFQWVKR